MPQKHVVHSCGNRSRQIVTGIDHHGLRDDRCVLPDKLTNAARAHYGNHLRGERNTDTRVVGAQKAAVIRITGTRRGDLEIYFVAGQLVSESQPGPLLVQKKLARRSQVAGNVVGVERRPDFVYLWLDLTNNPVRPVASLFPRCQVGCSVACNAPILVELRAQRRCQELAELGSEKASGKRDVNRLAGLAVRSDCADLDSQPRDIDWAGKDGQVAVLSKSRVRCHCQKNRDSYRGKQRAGPAGR